VLSEVNWQRMESVNPGTIAKLKIADKPVLKAVFKRLTP